MTLVNKAAIGFLVTFILLTEYVSADTELTNREIDFLKSQLVNASDSIRVDLLNKIAYNYYFYKNDSTDHYAKQAMALSDSLMYLKGLAEAQRLLGVSFKAKNDDMQAIEWLYKGLRTSQSINYNQGIADNLNSLGIYFKFIENLDQALIHFHRSLKYQRLAGNRLREGLLYTNIGGAYLLQNNLDSSEHFFKKSLTILDSIGDQKWQAMVYSQYGALLIRKDQIESATQYSELARKISEDIGQTFHLRKAYQNLAEIALRTNDHDQGLEMANKATVLSRKIGFFPYLVQSYHTQYEVYAAIKDYGKAIAYHQKYASYQDSLRWQKTVIQGTLVSYKDELARKNQENERLRRENEAQLAENAAHEIWITRQTTLTISAIVLLVLVSVFAIVLFRLRLKEKDVNRKLINSNKELEEQKEELSATLQMVEHLNAQLQAQNNTLNKIAIVSLTDLQGHIISVNNNFCEVSGYTADELLSKNHNMINSGHHDKEFFNDLWKTISSGKTWRGDIKNKKKGGGYFWADTAIAPVLDDEGKPKQFFSLQFDVTEREDYLEDIYAKSQELEEMNKLKDKLLSVVSHDFRSPLNSLRGSLALFLNGGISEKEMKMLTQGLVRKLDNTYDLLENLLSWAKSQMQGTKVYMKDISLHSIAEDCVQLLAPVAEKKLVKIINMIDKPIIVYADNEMVKLVLRNLISNAIKFTLAGNEIIVDSTIDSEYVTIMVKDNGIGISNENQDKLFKLENFSTSGTSNESGMGLGLLLCKDFIEKQGGKIWFESEYSKGSTFYFTLPMEEKFAPKLVAEIS